MFSPDPNTKPVNTKLPKAVIMMIEKNNLVMAIKTLAAEENISMDDAKIRIDAYETQLKVKQQQQLSTIANKQGIPNQAISFDRSPAADADNSLSSENIQNKNLQKNATHQVNNVGHQKPLRPSRTKRLVVIAIITVGLCWILWQMLG